MKLKRFFLAFALLTFAAVLDGQAQFNMTGSITGRVVATNGRGVRRATVSVMNLQTLETQTRLTNDFGYFRINDLPIINLYLVTVESKSHSFLPSDQLVEFTELEHNLTFTAAR